MYMDRYIYMWCDSRPWSSKRSLDRRSRLEARVWSGSRGRLWSSTSSSPFSQTLNRSFSLSLARVFGLGLCFFSFWRNGLDSLKRAIYSCTLAVAALSGEFSSTTVQLIHHAMCRDNFIFFGPICIAVLMVFFLFFVLKGVMVTTG